MANGFVPFRGPNASAEWATLLDLYLELMQRVDDQIARVLSALRSKPDVAANTVVVFTADHSEYGGSHGLRGKGGGAYEEAIRVPLCVHDPRGKLTTDLATPRQQLTSSADLMPLLLTIATGSSAWRQESGYDLQATMNDAIATELRAPLPSALVPAQREGFDYYFRIERQA